MFHEMTYWIASFAFWNVKKPLVDFFFIFRKAKLQYFFNHIIQSIADIQKYLKHCASQFFFFICVINKDAPSIMTGVARKDNRWVPSKTNKWRRKIVLYIYYTYNYLLLLTI